MLTVWLHHLDVIGMDDPDNNEGHPEDRCSICEWPIIDHPGRERWNGRWTVGAAKWPHRRAVLIGLILGRL